MPPGNVLINYGQITEVSNCFMHIRYPEAKVNYILGNQILFMSNETFCHCDLLISLKWDQHIKSICDKANGTIGFLRRNLNIGASSIKDKAYFIIERPLVECASRIWDPHTHTNVQKQEPVQRRAARYVKNIHRNTSSVSDMLSTLNW